MNKPTAIALRDVLTAAIERKFPQSNTLVVSSHSLLGSCLKEGEAGIVLKVRGEEFSSLSVYKGLAQVYGGSRVYNQVCETVYGLEDLAAAVAKILK